MTRQHLARAVVLVSTILLSWGALTFGATNGSSGLEVREVAGRDYIARRSRSVEDTVATEAARQTAAASVTPILRRDDVVEAAVLTNLERMVSAVEEATEPQQVTLPAVPPTTTTSTTAPDADTGTTVAETPEEAPTALVSGFLFVDVDGDGNFDQTVEGEVWRADFGLAGVDVVLVADDGTQFRAETDAEGRVEAEVPQGAYTVVVDRDDPDYPERFGETTEGFFRQEMTCESSECELEPVGLAPRLAPLEQRVQEIAASYPSLDLEVITTLARFAEQDLIRPLLGQPAALSHVEEAAVARFTELFRSEITLEELPRARGDAETDPRTVRIDENASEEARLAVNELVSEFLASNMEEDVEATQAAIERAVSQVQPEMVDFEAGDLIIGAGERFEQLDIDAIEATGAALGRTVRLTSVATVLTILVAVLALYLQRFRPGFWGRPRMVALFGMLIVLAAASVRLTEALQARSSWYVLPAVAFGYLAAVLFDARMGTLMALAMGILAAVGTFEPGVAVFGVLATMAPIGFVSSVSSRRAFRNSVVISGLAAAVIAAACSWLFNVNPAGNVLEQVLRDAGLAGAVALVASLVALAAMPFFEAVFDITTTLRLLELTDRNHEALQLLQERAFGTFNHSLMVGTLADTAAKAIGANNLLARAAAYFHDLGKTENPVYYIENQFGAANPHDDLTPEESAEILRRHVVDGVALAERFGIPSEVAEGIVTHHGDGIMRFFYEKARQRYGEDAADPDEYRHAGHKPQSREMAILMMADSVEGACRAVFTDEEPTPDALAKVVNRVIDEKVADGQLSECDLTLGELTRVRRAFIGALVGHYHQRIPYPNFPGN